MVFVPPKSRRGRSGGRQRAPRRVSQPGERLEGQAAATGLEGDRRGDEAPAPNPQRGPRQARGGGGRGGHAQRRWQQQQRGQPRERQPRERRRCDSDPPGRRRGALETTTIQASDVVTGAVRGSFFGKNELASRTVLSDVPFFDLQYSFRDCFLRIRGGGCEGMVSTQRRPVHRNVARFCVCDLRPCNLLARGLRFEVVLACDYYNKQERDAIRERVIPCAS